VRWRRVAFALLTLLFGAAAVFHLWAIVDPKLDDSSPTWRHALFVLMNLACAAGFRLRPPPFVYLFGLLVLQQLGSHGLQAWRIWQIEERFDWTSLGVLVVMPLALALLVAERRAHAR
jgi:hypothetical protein